MPDPHEEIEPHRRVETNSVLGGRLLLRQFQKGHRAGTDAILLAAAAPQTSGLILDAGAGTGIAGLALLMRCPDARVDLVEIDPDLANLAAENLVLNGFGERGRAVSADLLVAKSRRAAGLSDSAAAVVITNPPYLDPAHARVSPDSSRALAHAERPVLPGEAGGLEGWMRAVTALLAPDGTLVMIHRADRIGDILQAAEGRIGGVSIRPIQPRVGEDAMRVLVRGQKGSRAPLRLRPALVLHEADGAFTPLVAALHQGAALSD